MLKFSIFFEKALTELILSESSKLGIPAFIVSKTSKMRPHRTLKIPIYDDYRMVLVFPSSSLTPSAPLNLEVCVLYKVDYSDQFTYQGGGNLTLVTNEKKVMKHSGYYLLAPFLPHHDYVLVPCNTTQMIYYEQNPECLQNYDFLLELKQPEVNKNYVIQIVFHSF